ncbi:flippase [Methanotorris formicicus]|uniref:Polysaccharide biosynthesis protein n=1 Tax=Methanotorris formicicus Mc-S-70 TaxID=647171 RepID=H1KZD2_9EURY|nr:flippase [Methanotorris formicicus]EHP86158.1 polysaccharide biosynthesis protein [Methanotorris formicicus Mc-S-70]
MSEITQTLQKIAKGTGIIFAGTIISMFFGFLSMTIIARHFSTEEYGVFNLALTILSIALVITTLGIPNSLPREIAFYKEKESSRVKELISTALIIVALNSLAIMMFLIFGSGFIAQVFNEERLAYALKIMAFALPFSALIGVIISTIQGFGRVREKVYFQNVVYPTVFLVLVVAGVFLRLSFTYVFFAYVVAQALTLLNLTFNIWKIKLFEFGISLNLKLGKELIRFSTPLLFTGILGFLMGWTDTLMLGYYKSSDVVGLYNSASPIAKLIPIFLTSAGFIYVPIASSLYAQGKIREMGKIYQILTKWIFLLTLPIFSVMFLFPEATISFFFGAKYVEANQALRILALSFMFHTFLGLNGWSLIIIRENNFIMLATFASVVLNIIIGIMLIPSYGMNGAAVATMISYFIQNTMVSFRLYKKTRIHPFSLNYVKPLVISFILLGIVQSLHLKVPNVWYAIPILIIFLVVYAFLVLLSRSIDKEDVELFLAIERRLGVDLGIIKRVLRRFV